MALMKMDAIKEFFDPNSVYFVELLSLTLAVLSLLVVRTLKSRLLSQPKDKIWGATLVSSYQPSRMFLILISLWYSIELVKHFWDFALIVEGYPVVSLLAAMHLSWFGFRVVNTLENAYLENTETGRLDQTAIIGIAKICRLALIAVLAIAAFDLLGLDASGLIALGSVSGAALAFASKDLVSNWFGGIMLYMDKPFKVGDWINSPDREIEGTVEYIGWRISKIRTFDMRPLYVPNAMFNNITVQNPSRMTHRRIKETIGVRYEDVNQVDAIVADIKSYLKSSDLIAQDQTIIVNFNGFGASSLSILIYCMTVTTDWVTFHQNKQTVLLAVADIVQQHGGEFAFPTQTVHLETEAQIQSAPQEV
jgi:MscS family membrane protein